MAKRKRQNDKQWSTKHYTENKRLENMDPTKKTEGEIGRASKSYSTSYTSRVTDKGHEHHVI